MQQPRQNPELEVKLRSSSIRLGFDQPVLQSESQSAYVTRSNAENVEPAKPIDSSFPQTWSHVVGGGWEEHDPELEFARIRAAYGGSEPPRAHVKTAEELKADLTSSSIKLGHDPIRTASLYTETIGSTPNPSPVGALPLDVQIARDELRRSHLQLGHDGPVGRTTNNDYGSYVNNPNANSRIATGPGCPSSAELATTLRSSSISLGSDGRSMSSTNQMYGAFSEQEARAGASQAFDRNKLYASSIGLGTDAPVRQSLYGETFVPLKKE